MGGAVYFEDKDIRHCLEKAVEVREMYEMYVLNGKAFPRSVDRLRWVCEEYLNKKIEIEYVDVPAEGSSIKASYWAINEDGKQWYRICPLTGMTEDELRFVLCKELFHVIFDDEEKRNLELSAHVEEYSLSLASTEDVHPNCSVAWETLAEIAAMEFLFPLEERDRAINGGTQVSFSKLASAYGVPRYYVESFCNSSNLEYIRNRIPG